MKPAVDRLVVQHPDGLVRFGVGVIALLVAGYGVTVIHTGASGDELAELEVVRDMLAIATGENDTPPAAVSAQTRRGDAG